MSTLQNTPLFLGGGLFSKRIRFRPQHIIYDFFKDDDGAQKQRKVVLPSGELPEPGEEEEEFSEVFFSFPLDRILLFSKMGETLMIARLNTNAL